jgi:hypothetical protein
MWVCNSEYPGLPVVTDDTTDAHARAGIGKHPRVRDEAWGFYGVRHFTSLQPFCPPPEIGGNRFDGSMGHEWFIWI